MDFQSRQTYAADPTRVHTMMTDPVFLTEVCKRAGAVSQDITVNGDQTRMVIKVPAPDQARRFVGDTLTIDQTITWNAPDGNGGRTGSLSMDVPGMPVDVSGRATTAASGDSTVVDYTGAFTVKIPLLGKKLEQQAMPYLRKALDVQQEAGNDYLAGNLT